MIRKTLFTILALMVALSMAAPAFAASKQVVEISQEWYNYSNETRDDFVRGEWKKTYKDGYLRKQTFKDYYSESDFEKTVKTVTYNKKGLVKTKTKTAYDGSKETVSYTYKGTEPSVILTKTNGRNTGKIVRKFNKKGLVTKETNYYYEGGKWVKSYYSKWTYDKKGRKTKCEYYSRNDKGKMKKEKFTKYSYSGKKRTEREYNQKGKLTDKSVYTLDASGRIKKCVHTNLQFKMSDGSYAKEIQTFKYYDNGQIKEERFKTSSGGDYLYQYRRDGRPKYFDVKEQTSETITKHKYNEKGLETEWVTITRSIDPRTGESKDISTETYTYEYENYYMDKYPETTYTYYNGELVSMGKTTYDYIVDRTPEDVLDEYGNISDIDEDKF